MKLPLISLFIAFSFVGATGFAQNGLPPPNVGVLPDGVIVKDGMSSSVTAETLVEYYVTYSTSTFCNSNLGICYDYRLVSDSQQESSVAHRAWRPGELASLAVNLDNLTDPPSLVTSVNNKDAILSFNGPVSYADSKYVIYEYRPPTSLVRPAVGELGGPIVLSTTPLADSVVINQKQNNGVSNPSLMQLLEISDKYWDNKLLGGIDREYAIIRAHQTKAISNVVSTKKDPPRMGVNFDNGHVRYQFVSIQNEEGYPGQFTITGDLQGAGKQYGITTYGSPIHNIGYPELPFLDESHDYSASQNLNAIRGSNISITVTRGLSLQNTTPRGIESGFSGLAYLDNNFRGLAAEYNTDVDTHGYGLLTLLSVGTPGYNKNDAYKGVHQGGDGGNIELQLTSSQSSTFVMTDTVVSSSGAGSVSTPPSQEYWLPPRGRHPD
jgi:hypothetical protein